jgi:hypothetical protein
VVLFSSRVFSTILQKNYFKGHRSEAPGDLMRAKQQADVIGFEIYLDYFIFEVYAIIFTERNSIMLASKN